MPAHRVKSQTTSAFPGPVIVTFVALNKMSPPQWLSFAPPLTVGRRGVHRMSAEAFRN
jgi:hypothetical protein